MASNLQGFLSKFNSSEGLYINQIDPLHTFDIKLAFYPKLDSKPKKEKGFLDKAIDSAKGAAKGAIKNVLNNATGGLWGSVANKGNVLDEKKLDTKMTFIDYISRGNMLDTNGEDSWFSSKQKSATPQLTLDISYYIQHVNIPQIQMDDGESINTQFGTFKTNGMCVKPSSNQFTMDVINTKASLAERIFYPWLREVTLPYWVYESQPYTTADITIDFSKHSDMKYLFVGCRPQQIETLKPSNELGSPMRSVTMNFDYMFVMSNLKRTQEIGDKLLDAGKSLLGGASNMLGF